MKVMIGLAGVRPGRFEMTKNPADYLAPYALALTLEDGRVYRGRLRSHFNEGAAEPWYEGFVTADDRRAFARDEELKRYPGRPGVTPNLDLWPCQVKINPVRERREYGPVYVGEGLSSGDADGGQIYVLFGYDEEGGPDMVLQGVIKAQRPVEQDADRAPG